MTVQEIQDVARGWDYDELMMVAAARRIVDGRSYFVGIGMPTTVALLANRLYAPDMFMVFESGTLGVRPRYVPLSVADEELVVTARSVVSVPELFNYWLQPGRIDVGLLGAGQIDQYGNINSTAIGPYDRPAVRLPGAGGAPEIAGACGETLIVLRQSPRSFVDRLTFVSSVGHADGPDGRRRLGLVGRGPAAVVTDMGILEPEPEARRLVLKAIMPGRTVEEVRAATGWDLQVEPGLAEIAPPTRRELAVLHELEAGRHRVRFAAAGVRQ